MRQNDIEYIKNNIRREDLSIVQQELYDCLGIELYTELVCSFGGSNITVPTLETLRKAIAKRKIREDRSLYESGEIRIPQLAKLHNVCESTVYNILKEDKNKNVDGKMD